MGRIISLLFLGAAAAAAQGIPDEQEGSLASDFRREGQDFSKDCKKIIGCLTDLVHDNPIHLTGGTLAPLNGFAIGPQFSWEHNLSETWRSATNLEAMATTSQSWMAGFNFRAIRVSNNPEKLKPTFHRPLKGTHKQIELEHDPELNFYAEAISLNHLDYYGLGQFTSRSSLAFYGMRQIITGGNAAYPLGNSGLTLFAEITGRWFNLRGLRGGTSPSIEQLYTDATATGLAQQTAFFGGPSRQIGVFEPGGGARFDRDLSARFIMNYSVTLDEFSDTTNSHYSFARLAGNFSHTIPIYRLKKSSDGATTRNREGSIGLEAHLVESFVPPGNVAPFYLDPTLGGADINGDNKLPSYPDYRFRAPNLLLFRASLEHSLWGPLGGVILADTGRVGLTRDELGFDHLRHSYGVGLTLRAGNFPVVQVLFAIGGHEGTHTIASISPVLVGGGGRPSLY